MVLITVIRNDLISNNYNKQQCLLLTLTIEKEPRSVEGKLQEYIDMMDGQANGNKSMWNGETN